MKIALSLLMICLSCIVSCSPSKKVQQIASESALLSQTKTCVLQYGAIGNGLVDDQPAIQKAIHSLNSGVVTIPAGTYRIGAPIEMKSEVSVICEIGTVIIADDAGTEAITFKGSVGKEYKLTSEAEKGDRFIQVEQGAKIAAGDVIHLLSVTNALNREDAESQWLGDGTTSLPYAYFAEWNVVTKVSGTNSYHLAKPLLFNKYQTDTIGLSETNRATSTVKIINPIHNSHWVGGRIERQQKGSRVINMEWAKACSIKDVVIAQGSRQGDCIRFQASYDCQAENIESINDPTLNWDYSIHHGKFNRFKTVGSQQCGFFRCKSSHSGQTVDFTYSKEFPYANIGSFCRQCVFTNCFEGATSHASCYQEEWINNRFLECFDDGLIVRGLMPYISNNLFTSTIDTSDGRLTTAGVTLNSNGAGNYPAKSYGIGLSYGATRHASVSNNTIRGFYGGFRILSSSTLDWEVENALVNISNNDISNCYLGLEVDLDATPNSFIKYINYSENNHSAIGRYMVLLREFSMGCLIKNNTLLGEFRDKSANHVALILAENNNPNILITGNHWLRPKGSNKDQKIYDVYIPSIKNPTILPKADWAAQSIVKDNHVSYRDEDSVTTSISKIPYIQHKE